MQCCGCESRLQVVATSEQFISPANVGGTIPIQMNFNDG
jgi:hypothetical protein